MKSLFYYLLQVIIASGILYAYYHFFLRNKKFHRYNRFYILMAAVISVLIPFLNIPVYFTHSQTSSSFVLYTLSNISSKTYQADPVFNTTQTANWLTWQNVLYAAYILMASLALLKIALSLRKIRLIIKQNPVEKIEKIRFVNTEEPGTPFSFFRWLFWNRKIELQSTKGEQIFRHELFHIEQKHSWDILFMEMLTVLFWVNPFFYLMKKELKAIHEFLADRFAVTENQKWEYAELLLMQALNTQNHLTNPFFHNQIKRRIAMLTTSTKPGHQYLRKVLVLPVAAIVLALFAFKYKEKENLQSQLPPGKTFTVVIDAGHGGSETGAYESNGSLEKDIVLGIAQKIKSLNHDDNLKLILTRDGDATIPLQNRAALSNENNADLFISFHVNAQAPSTKIQGKKSGIEVYVPYFNKTYYSENRILGSILLNYLYQVHTTTMSIQTRSKNKIWILENTRCPSAMIELGYMIDNNDLDYITQPENQEKIAEAVLQSIDQYFLQKENEGWEERKIEMTDTIPAITAITLKQEMNSKGAIIIGGKQNNSYSILSDSIIFKSDSQNADLKDALIIFNGKKIASKNISNKTVIAKTIIIYPKDDPEAIQKFGSGAKKGVIVFEDAKIQEPKVVEVTLVDTIAPDNKIFEKPEIQASFPGGDIAWRKYLERTLKDYNPADSGAAEGTYKVMAQFIVDEEGNLKDIKTLTHFGHGMENKVIQMLKNGPEWLPAMQNGHKVSAYVKQPVTFVIQEENDEGTNNTNKPISLNQQVNTRLQAIYPNPGNNNVTIPFKSDTEGKGEVKIYDKTGNLEKTSVIGFMKGANDLNINISSLAKGVYIIQATAPGKTNVRSYKLIKE